jgi:hypothetical protein
MRPSLLALSVLLAAPSCLAQDAPLAVEGYITHLTSPDIFDVNGVHVVLTPATLRVQHSKRADFPLPYLGEPAEVYGKVDRKTRTINPVSITLHPPNSEGLDVSGSALLDAILDSSPLDPAAGRLVRADGYPILITPRTVNVPRPPLTEVPALRTNVWITFHGRQREDGVVVATRITLTDLAIPDGETKLRAGADYDPASVDPDSKQGTVSKLFRGIDPKQIPPYINQPMQDRVNAIGAKLIPGFQRDLPETDKRKIQFKFQLIDQKKFHDALTLPNGVILVPYQVVERMQNDDQLATVLADNVATALERQSFRAQPARHKMLAADIAGDVGGLLIPGLGVATWAATGTVADKIHTMQLEQSGRVSLCLLHDAGYNIEQAPLAWWLLEPRRPKDIADTPVPRRSAYLYEVLGTTWRTPPATTGTASATSPAVLPPASQAN